MADDFKKDILLSVKPEFDGEEAQADLDKFKKGLETIPKVDLSKSVKTLKQELKEAQNEAQRVFQVFGNGSKEFLEAGKRVQSLKNDIDEVNLSISNFQPDNKLQPLVSIGKAATGAIQGVAGALAVVGVESDTAAQTIARLQGIMAFSDTLNSLGDLKDSFKNVNALIQSSTVFQKANNAVTVIASTVMKMFGVSVTQTSTAFKVLRGAIMATGIGLLIVGLTALVSKIVEWTSSTDEQEEAQKRLNNALEAQQALLESELKGIDFVTKARLARARIAGQTEAELSQIENEGAKDRIAALKTNYENLRAIAKDGSKRSVEDQANANKAQAEAYRKYLDSLSAEEIRGLENQADAAEKARDKAEQSRKQSADKAKQARDKELADIKAHQEEIRKLNESLINDLALSGLNAKQAELAKLGIDYKQQIKTIEDTQEEELNLYKKTNSESSLGKEKYHAGLNNIQTKYQDVSNNLLTKYLGDQFAIERKYTDQITEFVQAANNAMLDQFAQRRIAINKEIDELLVNATESQKQRLEELRSSQLNQVNRDQSLNSIDIKAQTNLITTTVNSTVDESDTPDTRRSKIEALVTAQIEAENAAYQVRLEQNKANKEELERLEAEHNANLVNINKQASDAKKAIDDAEFENKKKIISATGDILGQASEVLGQQTAAGKATAVASTTVKTYESATSAYAALAGIPIVGPALGAAAAGVAVAAGLANVKKILSVKVPTGAGSAGSVSAAPSITTAPVISSNSTNVTANPIQDVRVVNGNSQVQVRAVISERELRENQQRANFYNNESTI
ncbi:MAG: hypothetical protein ABW007_04040 [Chitinophagaceae bacterium]